MLKSERTQEAMTNTAKKPAALVAVRNQQQTVAPKASAIVRERIRERLKGYFDMFLSDATPEEHRLMLEVLDDWESNGGGQKPPLNAEEIPVLEAFRRCL
jgi:hypothetical protein